MLRGINWCSQLILLGEGSCDPKGGNLSGKVGWLRQGRRGKGHFQIWLEKGPNQGAVPPRLGIPGFWNQWPRGSLSTSQPLTQDLHFLVPLSWDFHFLVPLSQDFHFLVPLSQDFHFLVPLSQDFHFLVPLSQDFHFLLPLWLPCSP
uniref:Uncharacterized protein n=1 Tax=Serinus canaria TaxID=9135 RepID=A0A8C9N350_SERCA